MAINFPNSPTVGQTFSLGANLPTLQWTGTGWVSIGSGMAVDIFTYTATGSESGGGTIVTITGGYSPGMGIMIRNGAVQTPGDDVILTTGTLAVFTVPLIAGETLLFYKFKPIGFTDALVKSNNGSDIPDKDAFRLNVGTNEPTSIGLFFRSTAPQGYLKANGAAVLISAYPNLINIYCGDALNATADWGYRCTNPASPSTSRSISGDYIVLPDMRGEFIRGWDDGRGVDTGRTLWSKQAHMFESHYHQITGYAPRDSFSQGGAEVVLSNVGNINTSSALSGNYGTETRPRNLALLVCIKY